MFLCLYCEEPMTRRLQHRPEADEVDEIYTCPDCDWSISRALDSDEAWVDSDGFEVDAEDVEAL